MSDVYHPGSGGSKGFPPAPYGYPMHCNMSRAFQEMSDDERKCLNERKYWCFLLSRLFHFINSISVLLLNSISGSNIFSKKFQSIWNSYESFEMSENFPKLLHHFCLNFFSWNIILQYHSFHLVQFLFFIGLIEK